MGSVPCVTLLHIRYVQGGLLIAREEERKEVGGEVRRKDGRRRGRKRGREKKR